MSEEYVVVGDRVEVWNPKPTGARGTIIRTGLGPPWAPRVRVQWDPDRWNNAGDEGEPLLHLLRKIEAE